VSKECRTYLGRRFKRLPRHGPLDACRGRERETFRSNFKDGDCFFFAGEGESTLHFRRGVFNDRNVVLLGSLVCCCKVLMVEEDLDSKITNLLD